MSIDVQICSLVDSLQILEAVELVGAPQRSIRIRARSGFRDAQRVYINDYAVDNFEIISDTYIMVYPPTLFSRISLDDMVFAVTSASYTGGPARVTFGPTKNVRKVEGLQKLVQQVVKTLLSNAGSNRFTEGEGGDLLSTLGATMSQDARAQITAAVASSVSRTEAQIFAAQSGAIGLRASERLLSLQIGGVNFFEDNLEVRANVRMVTYAGTSINIPLTL